MSDNLQNDLRAMTEDMRTRRKQWEEEREKMHETRQRGEAR
jgi:flagellar motility protein MotE (MotC chaperone)